MRAAPFTLLCAALMAGCAFPFGADCTPRLATVSWDDARVYTVLGAPGSLRLGSVSQEILAAGLPSLEDPRLIPEGAVTREMRWLDPPLPDGEDRERFIARVHARQGQIFRPGEGSTHLAFSFYADDAEAIDAFDRFLAEAVDAPQAARDKIAADMRAGQTTSGDIIVYSTLTERTARGGPYAYLRANEAWRVDDFQSQIHITWPNWTFVLDVPTRTATFPNDAEHRTTTEADDGLPYFRILAAPGGRVEIQHGEGNSRLGMDEAQTRQWANESFALVGLPAPEFTHWRADWATCL